MKPSACLASLALAAMLALPAMAQEPITPQTTMREIRQNPAVQASGLYTDIHTWERDLAWFKNVHNNETLEEVVGSGSAASCAAGLNLLIQNYESGTQITYKLYSPEEIAAQPSRDHAELYYFPADPPNARYAVVLSGNALYYSGELRGGVSTAWELHEQGYAVFVLRYRIGREAGNNAPMDDLGRAIQFITGQRRDVRRPAGGLRTAGVFLRRTDRRGVWRCGKGLAEVQRAQTRGAAAGVPHQQLLAGKARLHGPAGRGRLDAETLL